MGWVSEHWADILHVAALVVAAASAISALTPSNRDDTVVSKISKVVDYLALNVGHAKPHLPRRKPPYG